MFKRSTFSISKSLQKSNTGIIAEHKRRSPSKDAINYRSTVSEVAKGYEVAGASAMSVLTDSKYFGGSLEDLLLARASSSLPILRKEFIIDPYQIIESKAYGADAILLIAGVLSSTEIKSFSKIANSLGLEVLLEVHNLEELERSLNHHISLLGVNNRDLKTFGVSIKNSQRLAPHIPDQFVKVSESGLDNPIAIQELKKSGYQGFLIGEHFMKAENPGKAATNFLASI